MPEFSFKYCKSDKNDLNKTMNIFSQIKDNNSISLKKNQFELKSIINQFFFADIWHYKFDKMRNISKRDKFIRNRIAIW